LPTPCTALGAARKKLSGGKMKKLALSMMILMSGSMAFADQCAYVSQDTAKKALKMIVESNTIQTLCEPCGETKAQTLDVKAIGANDVSYQGFWQVSVNNKGVDLAYTFVNGLNVAQLVGCPTEGVSPSIKK
jgi:hypothetical protein